ncbi:hypothetical protein BJV82DRAFT_663379 [Fennellomyces sp. T-0311]|nr:hypothetical protein BJV82DRAFT_663379 [Fennellomyces sp. T-0311]
MDLATALTTPPYDPRQKQPSTNDYKSHPSAFHPVSMPSPPELLHDSEDEDSTGSATPSLPHHPDPPVVSCRKSIPHRSPPAVKDAFQASAVDKSVVFQLDVRSHPFFPAPLPAHDRPSKCPDCKLANCCGMACTSRVICGESLLTALRKRVVQARSTTQQEGQRRRMPMQHHRAQRKTTHIDIPKAPSRLQYHQHHRAVSAADQDEDDMSYNDEEEDEEEERTKQVHHRPWLDDVKPTSPPRKRSRHETPSSTTTTTTTTTTAAPAPAPPQQQQQHHHASSGRPSRVKGPCQACQESSDGCMRKAFNWPFPTSSIYNDKGKKFVYLCNKCGLRYNKSGGCVCRHCRWVFCKEEKRKAMQHIEQMIRSRPDGKVDPDEDIENFQLHRGR